MKSELVMCRCILGDEPFFAAFMLTIMLLLTFLSHSHYPSMKTNLNHTSRSKEPIFCTRTLPIRDFGKVIQ